MNEVWGAYCPIPQCSPLFPRYVHGVYPLSRGCIEEPDDSLRQMTPTELDQMEALHAALLTDAFEAAQE